MLGTGRGEGRREKEHMGRETQRKRLMSSWRKLDNKEGGWEPKAGEEKQEDRGVVKKKAEQERKRTRTGPPGGDESTRDAHPYPCTAGHIGSNLQGYWRNLE